MNQKRKYDKDATYPRHPYAHRNGGYHMNLDDETSLKGIVGSVMKQIGQKMAKGDFNLATITKPIILTHPLSAMECLCFDYTFTAFLNQAAKTKDPLTRMQLIVAAAVASIHKTQSILKTSAPIDCVIGETVTRTKADGTRFYSEFIKADPPTALFQVFGPNDDWYVYGIDEVHAEISPTFTHIRGSNPRNKFIRFKDGQVYEMSIPYMFIQGVLIGDRILNFLDSFTIKHGQLIARISFSYEIEGKLTKFKKLFSWSKSEKPLSDLVSVQIQKVIGDDDEEEAFTLSSGSGSWLSYLQIDGDLVWTITDEQEQWHETNDMLPSDSFYRDDRKYMILNQNDRAQEQLQGYTSSRNDIEALANHDENLRKKKRRH